MKNSLRTLLILPILAMSFTFFGTNALAYEFFFSSRAVDVALTIPEGWLATKIDHGCKVSDPRTDSVMTIQLIAGRKTSPEAVIKDIVAERKLTVLAEKVIQKEKDGKRYDCELTEGNRTVPVHVFAWRVKRDIALIVMTGPERKTMAEIMMSIHDGARPEGTGQEDASISSIVLRATNVVSQRHK